MPRPILLRLEREPGAGLRLCRLNLSRSSGSICCYPSSLEAFAVTSSTSTRCLTLKIMPLISGRSSFSTVWPMRLRPSARTVPRWSSGLPTRPFFRVTLRIELIENAPSTDLLHSLAPGPRDLLGAPQGLQSVDRGLDDVERVIRAEALGQDVLYPRE